MPSSFFPFPSNHRFLASSFFALLAVFTGNAQALPEGTFPSSTSGNVITFANGTAGGKPAFTFGKETFTFNSDGTLASKSPVTFGPAGSKAAGEITGAVSKRAAAAAISRFASKAVPLVSTLIAAKQLMEELGYYRTETPAGPTLEREVPDSQGGWRVDGYGPTLYPTQSAACVVAGGPDYYGNPRFPNAGGSGENGCSVTSGSTSSFCGNCVTRVLALGAKRQPATQQELEDAIAGKSGWSPSSKLGDALGDALESGESVEVSPQGITGPATTPGEKSETVNKDGTTTTSQTTNNYQYGPNTVTVTTTTVNSTYNPVTNTTTVESTIEKKPELKTEPKTKDPCGLTGTTPCKIDETGTKADPDLKGKEKADEAVKPLKDFADNPKSKLPALPSLNWSFAFPSACTSIEIPAFSPFLTAIDVCQFQSMFHTIMTMVWTLGGLLGGISLFWRNTFSGS